MNRFFSNLGSAARIAMIVAVTGVVAPGAAVALNCDNATNPNKWPKKFDNGPYDCDGNAQAECSYLDTAQACCPVPSPVQPQEECLCAVYNASPAIFNATGINPPACDAYP